MVAGRLLVASTAAIAIAPKARAAVYVYDPNGQTPPTAASDGVGNFDPVTPDFYSAAGGTIGAFGNTTADTALFGVGGTAAAVTVGTVNAGTLQFNAVTGSYVLNGGTIALGTAGTQGIISLNGASGSLTPTINSAIASTSGLLIQGNNVQNSSVGLSVLTLTGSNTYTGITNLSGGVAVSVSDLSGTGNFGGTNGIVLNGTVGTTPSNAAFTSNLFANEGAQLIYTGATATTNVGLTTTGTVLNTVTVSNASTVLSVAGQVSTVGTAATLNKQGPGTLAFTNAANTFNILYVSGGTLTLGSAGATQVDTFNNVGNNLIVGGFNLSQAGAAAGSPNVSTLNILAGTTVNNAAQAFGLGNTLAAANQMFVANIAGTLNIGNNTLYSFAGAEGAGDTAVINVTAGGALNAANVKFNNTAGNTGSTFLNVSGGVLTVSNPAGSASASLVRAAGGPVTINLSGNAGQINLGSSDNITSATGMTSAIIQQGGSFNVSGNLGFNTGVGTYNLSGGTLVANAVVTAGTPTAGSGFVFNGGTLQAKQNSSAFFAVPSTSGMSGAQIAAGGGTIDTQQFNVSTGQAFSTGVTGATDGGLTKLGTGRLTFTGTSTYTGTTTVTAGALAVNGSLLSTGAVVLNGGTLDGTGSVGAVTVAAGAANVVTNGNGSSGTLTMNALTFLGVAVDNVQLAGTPSGLATPGQIVTNTLTTPTSGTVTLNVTGSFTNPGAYDLIQFSTLGGGGLSGFLLGTVTGLASQNQTTSLGVVGNDIVLDVIGAVSVDQFTGANGNDFSNGSNANNFRLAGTSTVVDFKNGDAALFDDRPTGAAAGNTTLNLGSAVAPFSTTFNNSSLAYTVNSTGGFGVGGSGALTKNGGAALTLNTSNSYTGGTTLNAGTLNIGNANALSTGPVTISGGTIDNTSGATIQLSNSAIAINGSFNFSGSAQLNTGSATITLSNNPTITVNGGSQLLFNQAITGVSSLTLAGTGTTTIAVISQFNSSNGTTPIVGTTINGGTLNLKAFFGALANYPSGINGGGTGLLLGPLNINAGATVNANFINALGYTSTKGVITTLTVNGTGVFNDYTDNSQGLLTSVVLGGGSILEQNAPVGGNPGNFNFNVNASSGVTTSLNTTSGSPRSTFTMGVGLANGGTLPINAASDLLITGPIGQATGQGSINKAGAGTLTLQDGYAAGNSYTGGTTITAGAIRINELQATPTNMLGTGTTNILSGGTLGGNGSTGGAVVVAGTITAGIDATTVGTLTTGNETWNGSGGYVAKATASTNDLLAMPGLTINASSGTPFTIFLNGSSGAALTTTGTVLANVSSGTVGYIQNAIATNALTLTATNVLVPNGYAPALEEIDVGGIDQLVAFATATPEPTSLLLLGVAAAPLSVGRRRTNRRWGQECDSR